MSTATLSDKKATMRDKRAQGIAAMGLVTREEDRFRVTSPGLRGRSVAYEVWRDANGRVRCSCLEFEEMFAEDGSFRCEHILAVKYSILAKNNETSAKQESTAQLIGAATKPNENTDASETQKAKEEQKALSVEREQNEEGTIDEQSINVVTNIRSLAKHEDKKEQTMNAQANYKIAEIKEPVTENFENRNNVVPFMETLRALRQQVDPKIVKTREGWRDRQGQMHLVEYIEWHAVADILDRVTPNWSHAVRDIKQIGDIVAVTAAITIDGITREGVGTGDAISEMGIKKAEHDALKRAAVKFGIARELYKRESELIEKQGAVSASQFPRDPIAKTVADLVTAKQLGMIRALAREAGVDFEEECNAVLGCKTDELSKRAASSLIDHLKKLSEEVALGNMRRAS
jgi:hypothetical protein